MTAVAKYSYEPQRDDELRLTKGDVVDVLEKSSDGWWKVQVSFCVSAFTDWFADASQREFRDWFADWIAV